MSLFFGTNALPEKFIEPELPSITVDDIYKQLFWEHFKNLCDYAFSILKDRDEAMDVVQNAFLKLWEKRAEIDLINSAKTYLFTTVYRSSLNSLRNQRTRQIHHQKLNREVMDNNVPVEFKETWERIEKVIEQLPDRCKEVFYKSRFDGKKYSQIGEEMGISVKTVEAQMGKALKFLRDKLLGLAIFWIIYFFI